MALSYGVFFQGQSGACVGGGGTKEGLVQEFLQLKSKEIRFFVERDADFKTKKLPLLKMLTVGIPLRSMDSSSLL